MIVKRVFPRPMAAIWPAFRKKLTEPVRTGRKGRGAISEV
jgi:hypothetical protein